MEFVLQANVFLQFYYFTSLKHNYFFSRILGDNPRYNWNSVQSGANPILHIHSLKSRTKHGNRKLHGHEVKCSHVNDEMFTYVCCLWLSFMDNIMQRIVIDDARRPVGTCERIKKDITTFWIVKFAKYITKIHYYHVAVGRSGIYLVLDVCL